MSVMVPYEAILSGEIRDPFAELYFLPMFYLFPMELLVQSEFLEFPRNPHVVFGTPKWRKIYHSPKFIETVIDGMASMVWKHFGIKAPMEDFSGYYPFWILARSGVWLNIAAQFGFNTLSMARASAHFQYPVLSLEQSQNIFGHFVDYYRQQHSQDKWIETVRRHPANEDYEPSRKDRRIYRDFVRKWYHTRSKWVKIQHVTIPEEWGNLDDDFLLKNPYLAADFRIDIESFLESLSEKERKIIDLLDAGYTQTEIAKTLGYANHSGVNKKVAKIARKYREYFDLCNQPELPPVGGSVKDNWNEMTDLLFPKSNPHSTEK